MTPSATCPGCGARLPAPPEFAGKTVRCARCQMLFQLPAAVMDAIPVSAPSAPPPQAAPATVPARAPVAARPVEPPRPVAPAPAVNTSTRDEEDDEEDVRPKRRTRKPDPPKKRLWLWLLLIGVGLVMLLFVGCVLVAVYLWYDRPVEPVKPIDDPPAQYFPSPFDMKPPAATKAESWVKMAPGGTTIAWEYPPKAEFDARGSSGVVPQFGENSYSCQVRQFGQQSMNFATTISHSSGMDRMLPGQTTQDFVRQTPIGTHTPWGLVTKKYDIQGRTAIVLNTPAAEKVILLITEPGKAYRFEVFGPNVNEEHELVQRHFASIQFRDGDIPNTGSAGKTNTPSVTNTGKPPTTPVKKVDTEWARTYLASTSISAEVPPKNEDVPEIDNKPSLTGGALFAQFVRTTKTSTGAKLMFHVSVSGFPPKPGQKPDLSKKTLITHNLTITRNNPQRYRIVKEMFVDRRPGMMQVSGEKEGGAITVTMMLQEGDLTYTLFVNGDGINEHTPEVKRFLDSVGFEK